MDGGVAAVGVGHLGVRDQGVAVEDADGAGGHVVPGALPVADDVGLLDHDLADVDELLGGHHGGHGGGVGGGQRALDEAVGQGERCGHGP